MKGGRLKILLFKFTIFDLNLAVFVFLLFKGCVQFVRVFFKGCHICFKHIRNSAKDVHKILFKLEEFVNIENLPGFEACGRHRLYFCSAVFAMFWATFKNCDKLLSPRY